MFRTADPTRRIPTYLQTNTKENIIWQLKLTALILLGFTVWDKLEMDGHVEAFKNRRSNKK